MLWGLLGCNPQLVVPLPLMLSLQAACSAGPVCHCLMQSSCSSLTPRGVQSQQWRQLLWPHARHQRQRLPAWDPLAPPAEVRVMFLEPTPIAQQSSSMWHHNQQLPVDA